MRSFGIFSRKIFRKCFSRMISVEKRDISSVEAETSTSDEPTKKKPKREKYFDPRPTARTESKPLSQPCFFVENHLKKVRPYWFQFAANCKQRWMGKKLIDVFQQEIYHRSPDFFLPVLNQSLKFIENNEDVVVVDKPCSLPIHPAGRYYYNTLTGWLEFEHGIKNLKMLHRIDRLTSGIVIMSKTAKVDAKLKNELQSHKISKEYVARVVGEFPKEPVVCDKSIETINLSMGIQGVSSTENAKSCLTNFERLSFNGTTSLVRCMPKTGRTHQIRVHLQYLGFPIVNDHMYNNTVWGPEKGKNGEYGKSLEQLKIDLLSAFSSEHWLINQEESVESFISHKNALEDCEKRLPDDKANEKRVNDLNDALYDPMCPDCHMTPREPTEQDLEMYLHCLKYEGSDWSYCSDLPYWAKDDYTED